MEKTQKQKLAGEAGWTQAMDFNTFLCFPAFMMLQSEGLIRAEQTAHLGGRGIKIRGFNRIHL